MNKVREELIRIAARIAEIRADLARLAEEEKIKQKDLKSHERALDQLLGPISGEGDGSPIQAEVSDDPSLNEQIIRLLDANPIALYTAESVHREIPGAKLVSVRTALAKLAADRKILRERRGEYRAMPRATDAEAA